MQPFMINAFIAGVFVAICASILGYFIIVRRYTFASHALGHIGIPGATGAAIIGMPYFYGMLIFCVGGGVVIGALSKKNKQRDIATGTILAFALALGFYFSSLSSKGNKTLNSVLFGSILGVSDYDLLIYMSFCILVVLVVVLFYKSLLFSSLSPEIAKIHNINNSVVNIVFVLIMSITCVMSVQLVGSLLLFALQITPASSAICFSANPKVIIILSICFALFATLLGIVLSVILNVPISFAVVTLSVIIWFIAQVFAKFQ